MCVSLCVDKAHILMMNSTAQGSPFQKYPRFSFRLLYPSSPPISLFPPPPFVSFPLHLFFSIVALTTPKFHPLNVDRRSLCLCTATIGLLPRPTIARVVSQEDKIRYHAASEGPCRLLTLCIQYSTMHCGSFGAGLVVLWQSKSRNQTKPKKRGALSNFVAGA